MQERKLKVSQFFWFNSKTNTLRTESAQNSDASSYNLAGIDFGAARRGTRKSESGFYVCCELIVRSSTFN